MKFESVLEINHIRDMLNDMGNKTMKENEKAIFFEMADRLRKVIVNEEIDFEGV
ncbi:MAG: hypothetical protein M0R80_00885 [Proteobacteria bacterium]|jgi:hypothetical protein|nr:hypothetical protein [Pseudomonadota bacterium]